MAEYRAKCGSCGKVNRVDESMLEFYSDCGHCGKSYHVNDYKKVKTATKSKEPEPRESKLAFLLELLNRPTPSSIIQCCLSITTIVLLFVPIVEPTSSHVGARLLPNSMFADYYEDGEMPGIVFAAGGWMAMMCILQCPLVFVTGFRTISFATNVLVGLATGFLLYQAYERMETFNFGAAALRDHPILVEPAFQFSWVAYAFLALGFVQLAACKILLGLTAFEE